jgi:hypothetical protein
LEGHKCIEAASRPVERLERARAVLDEVSERVGAAGSVPLEAHRDIGWSEPMKAKSGFDRAAWHRAYMKNYMKAYMRGWRARRKADG